MVGAPNPSSLPHAATPLPPLLLPLQRFVPMSPLGPTTPFHEGLAGAGAAPSMDIGMRTPLTGSTGISRSAWHCAADTEYT